MEDPRDTLFGAAAPGSAQEGGVYVRADEETFRVAGAPAWRVKRKVGAKSRNPDAPLAHLLADTQWHLGRQERYQRTVRKLQTQRAVQECSRVEVPFDPTHESLTVHQVKIWRGKESIDAGGRDHFRLLQRETNLESHIYDGMLSAVLILQDVRVGDIIDFSFTVREKGEGFRDKFSVDQTLEWPVAMQQFHLSLHVPKGRKLRMRYHKEKLPPEIVEHEDGSRIFTWSKSDATPIVEEANVPPWYWPYQRLEVSEFGSWQEVAAWTREKWAARDAPSEAMEAEVARIASECATPKDRVEEAVRFVQDEIRYLAVGVGVGSYVPSAPQSVMGRRIGDCKDKSLLLSRMLEGLGVWARPALVNTVTRRHAERSLPALGAFDHAIVVCELEGRRHWIDPTACYQRGALGERANPGFGCGLIIDENTEDLVEIAEEDEGSGEIEVWERFVIGEEPARLESKTVWRGSEADRMRFNFHSYGRDDLNQRFSRYYEELYPGLRGAGEYDYEDDEASNTITLKSDYEIEEFAQPGNDQRTETYVFVADAIKGRLVASNQTVRKSPFAILHPVSAKHHIEIEGDLRGMRRDRFEAKVNAFEFRAVQTPTRHGLRLDYEYRSKKDHVPPPEYRDFAKEINKVANTLGYVLELPREQKRRPFKRSKGRPLQKRPGESEWQSTSGAPAEPADDAGEDELAFPEPGENAAGSAKAKKRAKELWERAREGAPEPMPEPEPRRAPAKRQHRGSFETDTARTLKGVFGFLGLVILGVLIYVWTIGTKDRGEVRADGARGAAVAMEDSRIKTEQTYLRARAAFHNNELDRARKLLTALEKRHPDNSVRLYHLAYVEFRSDNLELAEELNERALARRPSYIKALLLRAYIAHSRNDNDRVIESFLKAAELDPVAYSIQQQLSQAYEKMGRNDDAVAAMEKARELKPRTLETLMPLALLYERLERYDDAKRVIESAIRDVPQSGVVWLRYAEYLLRRKQLKDAAWAGKSAIQYGPDDPSAYAIAGQAQIMRGEIEEAEIIFTDGLAISPKDPRLLYGAAVVLMEQGIDEGARERFEEVLEIAPTHVRALNNLGVLLLKKNELDRAATCFERALELDPQYVKAKENLAEVRAKQGKPAPPGFVPVLPPASPAIPPASAGKGAGAVVPGIPVPPPPPPAEEGGR